MNKRSALRGFLAFFIILMMMPLGHAFVVLMERNMEGATLKTAAFVLGLGGITIALCGNRLRSAAMQVLAGAFGAILFWGAWVEFSYICYGQSLHVPPLMHDGAVYTKPEYLMMPSSAPFTVLALIMYVFMARTNWGVILLIRKYLGIKVDLHDSNRDESVGAFIDLLLLIWWTYLILLVEFDPGIFGVRHPVTMIFATVCLVGGLILFVRSLSAPNWASALRQAIVTVCVLWTYVEVLLKMKLFTEIWIYPEKFVVPMVLMVIAFIAAIWLMAYFGHKNLKKKEKV